MKFISPSQCRAARGLLNWSQPDLAEKCGMHVQTISAFENETGTPTKTTLEKVKRAFEKNGIGFLKNDGIERPDKTITEYQGKSGFKDFMLDVLKTTKETGKQICVSNVDENNWEKNLSKDFIDNYQMKMKKFVKIKSRVLLKDGDTNNLGETFTKYRNIPADMFTEDASFYAYGCKLALINFYEDDIEIVVLENKQFSESFRVMFNVIWENHT